MLNKKTEQDLMRDCRRLPLTRPLLPRSLALRAKARMALSIALWRSSNEETVCLGPLYFAAVLAALQLV
jgi:hypothetical protein